jgi:hypothetical protein
MPLRIDVMKGESEGEAMSLAAWETYRGNDWDNKGEAVPLRESGKDMSFELRLLGGKNYFVERMKCEFPPTEIQRIWAVSLGFDDG